MVNFRDLIDVVKEIEKEQKRKDIKEIFENKSKTRLVKIAPFKKHPKPVSKTFKHSKSNS